MSRPMWHLVSSNELRIRIRVTILRGLPEPLLRYPQEAFGCIG